MAHTIKLKRSDVYPIGTTVRAFAYSGPATPAAKPAGAELASATVDAVGQLELTGMPDSRGVVLWAEVGGEHRTMAVGDPARDIAGTLKERVRRRRALAKA